jgi:hypothetical protein
MTALAVVRACGAILRDRLFVDSVETLATRAHFRHGGIYDWRVLRTAQAAFLHGPAARVFDGLFAYPAVLALPVVQIVAAPVLIGVFAMGGVRPGREPGRPGSSCLRGPC